MRGRHIPGWSALREMFRAPGTTRPAPPGFAEASEAFGPLSERRDAALVSRAEAGGRVRHGRSGPARDLPFPSTGPQGHRQRLRDKLVVRGGEALEDYELLEMLLFFAQPKGDTKPLAKAVINRFGSFAAVLTAPSATLIGVPGLGPHSVAAIRLVQASALRLARAQVADQPVLNNPERLSAYLRAAMSRESIEQFRVLFLDTRNRLLADEVQGRGTVNHTPVYPREVVKRALELHATALILAHNHPSGDPTASAADIEMTDLVRQAAATFGIVIHDHVIVGRERNFSFRFEGLL